MRENGSDPITSFPVRLYDRLMDQERPHRLKQTETGKRRIKKLAPELRRGRNNYAAEKSPVRRLLWRMKENSQFLRTIVQLSFVLLCVWIGIEFHYFVRWGMSRSAETYFSRPPGVEGFLPISALISLKYWIGTSIINEIHPAGLFILLAIVLVSVIAKKSFCGWLCPIGTLSESLWMFGRRLFGKNISVHRWVDMPLRSIKYLLLFFFVYSIGTMGVEDLQAFIYSPYNKVADVKMYLFFSQMTSFAFWSIGFLIIGSIVIRNFWCRYLCPYGALLGALSWLSPLKIFRKAETCIDCELCTKACPASITVHKVKTVWSDECVLCLKCVDACPVKSTLEVKNSVRFASVPSWLLGTLIIGVFVAVTGLAMIAGHWQNGISQDEYLRRMQQINAPVYQHFGGQVPNYGPND